MSVIKILAPGWNVGLDRKRIDNSKLREQARQQRQNLARLQHTTEKQATKNLFGPPIPVSRPNDPTFEQLSNFFGSPLVADISCFRSTSTTDCSPTDDSQGAKQRLVGARHGAEHRDSRHVEQKQVIDPKYNDTRQSEIRRGDARHRDTRHVDARRTDARHGDTRHSGARHRDSRPSDNQNVPSDEPVVKSSRPDHSDAALDSGVTEPLRQGVFEQFVKSSSLKALSTANYDRAPKSSKSRQSVTEEKSKRRTSLSEDSKLDESSVPARVNVPTNSRPELQLKQPMTSSHQSKYSSGSGLDSSQTLSSSFPPSKMNSVKSEANGSPFGHGTSFGNDFEKASSIRVNGTFKNVDFNVKSLETERKKPSLPFLKEYEKCDGFVKKVIQEISIRSPLTGILTPMKADIPFFFPDTNHECSETIPEGHLSSEEEEDDGDKGVVVDKVSQGQVQRPEHQFDSTGKTIPNPSSNLLDDLKVSDSSDSEIEQVELNGVDQKTPDSAVQRSTTDQQKSSGIVSLDEEADGRRRHLSVSSEASSSEGSYSSGSDCSESENEDDKEMKKIDVEYDETDAKQSKRTSWEIKNFIPKSNELVPFKHLLSSSPSSPFANAACQLSGYDFDSDIGENFLSSMPMSTASDADHPGSDHSADAVHHLSRPKISPTITINGKIPVAPLVDSCRVDPLHSKLGPKSFSYSPPQFTPISGVEYDAGRPSVIVRIQRSRLAKNKSADCKDSGGGISSLIRSGAQVNSSKSGARVDHRSPTQPGCRPDLARCSPESVAKFSKSASHLTPSKGSSCYSSNADGSSNRTPLGTTPKRANTAPAPPWVESSSTYRTEQRVENSPAKIHHDSPADASKTTKRKLDDVCQSDQKKICDRSWVNRKEDRKSRSQQQNGGSDVSQKFPLAPDIKIELKSPVANGDDSNSKLSSSSSSSSSAQPQKRTERTKPQDGNARTEEKIRKTSTSKVNGKLANSETVNSVSDKSAKTAAPVVNGIGASPSHPNPNISCDVGLSGDLGDNKKRTADLDDINHLHFNKKNGIKMIKYEPEKLESSEVYLQNARKLKHDGDSGPDKFCKVLSYTESILAFVCHCSALEAEHAELARIQKMYQDTLALCQYVIRVMEGVGIPDRYNLIVMSLRIQAIISLRLYNIRKADVAKLKSVLDEHNKNHVSKPLQIPSPYQTSHPHSSSTTAASWNHANGTPSPRSPRPSPSPAGSIGSVGSAGSSNGESGMVKPMSFVNGHSLASIVVPQRIHSVMMNFVSYMNYLYQCHDYWDQADALIAAHPTVGDFFHSVNAEFGPIDLHSSTTAIVRYASEVVKHVRSEAKQSSLVRTD